MLVSIAHAATGHHEIANVKRQRCIPLGVSLTILTLLAVRSGKGFSWGLGIFFVWRLRVITKKSIHTAFHFDLNLISFDVVGQ